MCEFDLSQIVLMQRMTAMRAATAASRNEDGSPLWAVLEDGAIAQLSGCCLASDDREEPILLKNSSFAENR